MERLKADIVVLGAGGAGMAAAITAAEGGAKVVVLEKRPFPGGTSNTPAVLGVVRSDQAYRDKAFKVHMEMTNWTGNADLVQAWINKSGGLVDWLKEMGVNFADGVMLPLEDMGTHGQYTAGWPKGYAIVDVYLMIPRGRGHGGAQMILKMVARAKELGVEILLATPAKKILKTGERISGVVAEDKAGNQVQVDAKAVIVATAGFNDDAEMIKKYSGFEFTLDPKGTCEEGDFNFTVPGLRLTGDGIKMAWEVGADKGAMGIGPASFVPNPGITGKVPWMQKSQLVNVAIQPYLWVNQKGERFMDEGLKNQGLVPGGVVARQTGKCAYMIFDEDTRRYLEEVGPDYQYFVFMNKNLTDLEGDIRNVMAQGNKHVFIADSLEDMAGQMGIDPKALKNTVDEYNNYCEKGHDDQFAKDPRFLRPVKKGKFYGMRAYNIAHQTIGGIKVNRRTEALTKDLDVIPGLYAAGDIIVAELFGDPPIIGAGSIGFALASGCISGESALEYI